MKRPLSVQINVLSNLIHRRCDEYVTAKLGAPDQNYTETNAKVIGFLMVNNDRDIFQKDIEEALQLRRSTVSTLLQGMEKKGFITRESVASDARVKKIIPTNKALEIQKEISPVLSSFEKSLAKGISPEEEKIFLSVLKRLESNLH